MPNSDSRREFLKASAIGLSVVLTAGCRDLNDLSSDPDTPTPTPEPFIETTPSDLATDTPDRVVDTDTELPDVEDVVDDTPTEDPAANLGHLNSISGGTYPPDILGNHHRRFEWSAVGYDWWIELQIPRSIGEYYKSRYGRSRNYDMYVSDPYGDEHIQFIVGQFEEFRDDNDLSQREMIEVAMNFVQQMQYTPDDVSTGFNQYTYFPVETLIERGGDCEDSTILLAAILQEMGYGCILLGLWEVEHMALGVRGDPSLPGYYWEYDGNRYYYVETTGDGTRVGEIPEQFQNANAEIFEIQRYPVLVHAWETSVLEDGTVAFDIGLRNVGDVSARSVEIAVSLQDRLEQPRASDSVFIDTILREEETAERLLLRPPENETLRVRTELTVRGNVHDYDQSEWREPF